MQFPENYNSDYQYFQLLDDTPLHLIINEVGVNNSIQSTSNSARSLQMYSIHYVMKGYAKYLFGGKEYTLHAGDVVLIYPGMVFQFLIDTSAPWQCFWLNFNGESVESLLKTAKFSMENPVYSFKNTKKLNTCIRRLMQHNNTNSNLRLHAVQTFAEFFALLTEERATDNSKQADKYFYIQNVINHIHENYHNANLTIENICQKLSISHSHLCRLFHAHTGTSIYHYLLMHRIQNAKLLLENTNDKIVSIANAVGYSNVSYFCSEFKRIVGSTPTQYRHDFRKFVTDNSIYNKYKA